jgi:cysteine desulfurase family protein (TIGR01976 family)
VVIRRVDGRWVVGATETEGRVTEEVNHVLDVGFARSCFPALPTDWALLDNAGGSVAPRQVIERVREYMETYGVQLGASYPLSVEASRLVEEGQRAAAELVNADPGEIVLASSSTVNASTLAEALRPGMTAGDEVIVTNLDHEANIGPWRRLESSGIVLREWCFDPQSAMLRLEELEPLLSDRTRLVCFTHCANVVGAIHDVAAITRRVHEAGARVCVDGVAFAPHRRVDVKALDVDFYLVSLYKTFGPHMGLLYGKRDQLLEAKGQYHFFVGEEEVPYKFQPGNVNYELTWGAGAVVDYIRDLGDGDLETAYARMIAHERVLGEQLLAWLATKSKVRVIGNPEMTTERVPTVSFIVDGLKSSQVPPHADDKNIGIRWGDFYARRLIDDLGLSENDGVVRVSMVHYNTEEEVDRLVKVLDSRI